MPLANRVICSLLFRPSGQGEYVCNSCNRQYRSAHGYTNLMNHLRRFHPGFEAEAETALRNNNALRLHVVDARTSDIYRCVEWVVEERLPFTFCERRLVRQNAKMGNISAKTLAAYVTKLHEHVQGRVRAELPDKFALVMDGWTSAGWHYVAIFAVFDDTSASGPTPVTGEDYFDDLDCLSRRFLLLAFSPVDEEEDLSAQSLFDLIADTLSLYERPWDAVLCMIGDNCSVNQYIGRREGAIPFIGCASHRFNLAMRDLLAPEETALSQVHSLMKALSKLKCCAMLRKKTHLDPVARNDTRWSSSYEMVNRYCRLEPVLRSLDHGSITEYALDEHMLSRIENEKVFALRDTMEKMEGVTQALQRSTLTLSGVRRLFDRVDLEFLQLRSRLAPTAAIVNNAPLESGLVKLQRQEQLTAAERSACAPFRLSDSSDNGTEDEVSNPSLVRDAFKRRKVSRRQRYLNVAFIPPTSNECERFFSAVKLVFTDLRKRLEPETLEALMSLSINGDLWDVHSVEEVRIEMES